MSFDTYETSVEQGTPVELYQLTIGTETYYMTSTDVSVVALGNTFVPTELTRTQVQLAPDEKNEVVEVTMPSDHAFPAKFTNIIPGSRGVLTIYRFHKDDVGNETQVIFKGIVRSVGFALDGYQAKLAVMPLTAALSRTLPRFTFQGLCNNFLYDQNCKMVQNNFRYTNTCAAVSSDTLTLTVTGLNSKPNGWATGGFIQVGSFDFRLIIDHTGNNVTLLIPFPASVSLVGQSVDIFAGCDHTIATCKTKFNNVGNFGGYAFVPKLNVFTSGIQ